MSTFYPGARRFADNDWVRTPVGDVGRVVGAERDYEPSHDMWEWDDDANVWTGPADQILEHVYTVEFLDAWGEPYNMPWPEDWLEAASVLDALTV